MKSWFWMSYWHVLPWDFWWWFAAHWGIPGRVPAKCVYLMSEIFAPIQTAHVKGSQLGWMWLEWRCCITRRTCFLTKSVRLSVSQMIFCRFYPYPLHECRFVSAFTASSNFLWHFEVELGAGNKKCKPILAAGNETRNDNGIKIRKKWSRHASF